MAIAEKLNYLLETKNEIKNAIKNKGIEVTDAESFRSYANKINSMQPSININGITEECKVSGGSVNVGDFVTLLSNNGETNVKTITSPTEQIGGIAITGGTDGETVVVKKPAPTKLVPTETELAYNLQASKIYNGEEQPITVTAKAGVEGLGDITIKYNGATTVPINAGQYKITVDIAEGENYTQANEIELGTYIIVKATYDMSGIKFEDKTFTYDGKIHRLDVVGELPEGVTVSYTGNRKSDVGEYTVIAKFNGDTENYNTIPNMSAKLIIIASEPTKQTPTKEDLMYKLPQIVLYNEEEQPITVTAKAGITGLGKITIKYNGEVTAPIEADEYIITVDIENGENYTEITDIELGTYKITNQPIIVDTDNRTIMFVDTRIYKATITSGDEKTVITLVDKSDNQFDNNSIYYNIDKDGIYYITDEAIEISRVWTLRAEKENGDAYTPVKFKMF